MCPHWEMEHCRTPTNKLVPMKRGRLSLLPLNWWLQARQMVQCLLIPAEGRHRPVFGMLLGFLNGEPPTEKITGLWFAQTKMRMLSTLNFGFFFDVSGAFPRRGSLKEHAFRCPLNYHHQSQCHLHKLFLFLLRLTKFRTHFGKLFS